MLACRIHAKEDLRIEPADVPDAGPGRGAAAPRRGRHLRLGPALLLRGPQRQFRRARAADSRARGVGRRRRRRRRASRACKSGDKVAVSPSHACGRCDYCREGREQLCTNMRFLGSASLLPARAGHVPGIFRHGRAPVLSGRPATSRWASSRSRSRSRSGLHAVNRGGDLLGKSVLITGAGTIGCVTVLAARLAGARKITVSDVLDRPLAQAKIVGADVTLRADRDADALAEPQFDVAYEVSGNFNALKSCVAATQARRCRRPGRHAAARAAAVRRQRADGEGARSSRRVPLGHRVRLGGRLSRRRGASTCGRCCRASIRCRTPLPRSGAAADKNQSTKVQVVSA